MVIWSSPPSEVEGALWNQAGALEVKSMVRLVVEGVSPGTGAAWMLSFCRLGGMLRWLRVCALCTLLACPLCAIDVMFGVDPNSPVVVGSYGEVVDGVNLGGIVELVTSSGLGCSGALLSDGMDILTAGHCLTSSYGSSVPASVNVTFLGPNGTVSDTSTQYFVDPGWGGVSSQGSDLAILRLSSPAPSFAAGYSLYTGSFTSSTVLLAGYGYSGTGDTGANGSAYPFGTLRQGQNGYLWTGDVLGWSPNLYVGQFVANSNIPNQVDVAPGDSGGPSFYDGEIIGVHDFISCFTGAGGDCLVPPSTCTANDSCYGQLFADTDAAAYTSWIDSNLDYSAPEPGTAAEVLLGLCAASLLGRRRFQRRIRETPGR